MTVLGHHQIGPITVVPSRDNHCSGTGAGQSGFHGKVPVGTAGCIWPLCGGARDRRELRGYESCRPATCVPKLEVLPQAAENAPTADLSESPASESLRCGLRTHSREKGTVLEVAWVAWVTGCLLPRAEGLSLSLSQLRLRES